MFSMIGKKGGTTVGIGRGGKNLIKDDNEDNIYDLRVKNWGTENIKENETGKEVIKEEDDFITIE